MVTDGTFKIKESLWSVTKQCLHIDILIKTFCTITQNLVELEAQQCEITLWNAWHFTTFTTCLDVSTNISENVSEKLLFGKFIFALDRKACFAARHSETKCEGSCCIFELAVSVPHVLVFLLCEGMTSWTWSFRVKEEGLTWWTWIDGWNCSCELLDWELLQDAKVMCRWNIAFIVCWLMLTYPNLLNMPWSSFGIWGYSRMNCFVSFGMYSHLLFLIYFFGL